MKRYLTLCRSALAPLRAYLTALTPRAVRLLALGLIPIFLTLGFLLLIRYIPLGGYGAAWLSRSFAFWADSVGMSILLLVGGAALLDYSERHEGGEK